ncbi:minor tail protein [Gordonia phage Daredevil]|uniref:Glycine-rich domain-containing protein n=1 Tax=Gordonia phage Daredevil TaxID=2283286 RepID=A0A345MIP4_9CAUD|nr:minor tail protein [Gordonia phage Daredevil]AXH70425.1 hypothetical protein SEA_DAREDEVIL_37 [Gordonia phage Daredevil]
MSWSPGGPPAAGPVVIPGWSTDGPEPTEAPITTGWRVVQQRRGEGSGVGDDAAIAKARILTSGAAAGQDRPAAKPKLPGTGQAAGRDLATQRPRVAAAGSGAGKGDARFRLNGQGVASGDDLAIPKPKLIVPSSGAGSDRVLVPRAATAGAGQGAGGGTASASFKNEGPWDVTWTSGSNAYTFTFPVWCRYIDVILLGGGASGQTGSGAINQPGRGGAAGSWAAIRLERGVDIPWSLLSMQVVTGVGGAQAANSDYASPNAGAASLLVVSGSTVLTAAGGQGTKPEDGQAMRDGQAAGTYSFGGRTYTGGGLNGSSGGTGNPPGGGGSGGNGGIFGNRTRGGAGAYGGAWLWVYQ